MKKILFVIFTLSLIILINGCGPGGTDISAGGLPVAYSDETYTTTLEGTKCKLVGATDIGGTLSLADNCVISGTAPHADNTRIIPFKVEITDDKDVSKVHEMHLTVEPKPISFELPETITPGSVGSSYTYSFQSKDNPAYGNPPYTFTVSGQPMGLIMGVGGVLSGTIPEGATEKDYNLEVCVKDMSGNQACDNTVLKVSTEASLSGSIDSGTCNIPYVNEYGNGEAHAKGSGTVSGPVGTILRSAIWNTDAAINCGSWSPAIDSARDIDDCIRKEGDPETTTWNIEDTHQSWSHGIPITLQIWVVDPSDNKVKDHKELGLTC